MVEGASLEGGFVIYPELTRDDVLACLEYVRRLIAVMRLERYGFTPG